MTAYTVGPAAPRHLEGARRVMLDTFYREFGYGYRPEWHWDVIDLVGTYLRPERHTLVVALHGEEVVGTTAVRAGGPKSPPHPEWLGRLYPDAGTAQLFRVYVDPGHRRRGLAREMVAQARRFVADAGYHALYLHTDTRVEGAEKFWSSVAEPVFDGRDGDPEHFQTVHFEIALS
ncbi:GNAT superfamily N-acetyltransferase [Nonomuraea thailandensis]|uniref:GNAT superfamily N-acetyltransferase n=1 Tax=Nonomuraea thailandensis TaxID=1188745 RepID=A0A9X2GR89_9ACTN|nr:GNAT family N-acetyltransferase [Nonomuraea thailandensis]MCP2363696.1 GNAT superfamily N-acetyltransferase [Nonomuraea thailandensis]